MDSKDEFIQKKIDLCSNKITSSKRLITVGIILCSILTLISFNAACMLIPNFTDIAITLGLFGSAFPIYGIYHTISQSNLLRREKKKLKHLHKVKEEGIPLSDSLDNKRALRIHELEEEKSSRISNLVDEVIGGISASFWLVGLLASLVSTTAVYATIAALGVGLFSAIKGGIDENKIQKLQTRIDNLQEDLALESVFGYPLKSSPQKKAFKSKKPVIDESYSKEVADYIEKMCHEETVYDKPKQKMKK